MSGTTTGDVYYVELCPVIRDIWDPDPTTFISFSLTRDSVLKAHEMHHFFFCFYGLMACKGVPLLDSLTSDCIELQEGKYSRRELNIMLSAACALPVSFRENKALCGPTDANVQSTNIK